MYQSVNNLNKNKQPDSCTSYHDLLIAWFAIEINLKYTQYYDTYIIEN